MSVAIIKLPPWQRMVDHTDQENICPGKDVDDTSGNLDDLLEMRTVSLCASSLFFYLHQIVHALLIEVYAFLIKTGYSRVQALFASTRHGCG